MPDAGYSRANNAIAVDTIVQEIRILAECLPIARLREETENILRNSLPKLILHPFEDTAVNQRGYGRKLIYSHPDGHFSVLQLLWQPGSVTPIHGHNAWGVVGVVSGTIGCETYCRSDKTAGHQPERPAWDGVSPRDTAANAPQVISRGSIEASTGAIASVDPDPEGIHRLYNPTDHVATTLHVYGMDLAPNPCAINVPYETAYRAQAST